MTTADPLSAAHNALDRCETALRTLDAECCEPGRSPRMHRLARTLAAARGELTAVVEADPHSGSATLRHLEDAGAQIGRLQVGCCAPSRLPLYAEILEGLTTAQRTVTRTTGAGH